SLFEEPKPQRKPKKQVSFSQYSIMYHVPSVDTFTQEELEQAFTTEADYDRIHNENEITLAYMERGIYPDDEKLCFRGLEGGMRHIYTEKKRLTADAVSAVLKRQAEKKDLDDDNEWARHYYATYTYQSLANAFRIGAWDAQTNQIQRD
ncbi:MAG: hypothetical protein SGILL_004618, partial [Bacillariaceae sp.]